MVRSIFNWTRENKEEKERKKNYHRITYIIHDCCRRTENIINILSARIRV